MQIKNDPDIEIGSHTLSHPMLSLLDEYCQRREIFKGHNKLEELVGKKIKFFAYPYGGIHHFNKTSQNIVKEIEGLTAFSTYGGINRSYNRTDLKRITLTSQSPFGVKSLIFLNDNYQ